MPVDTKHPEYLAWNADWKKVRDVLGGERAIKAARTEYLAKIPGMQDDEYNAYLGRGTFFDASSRTLDGLLGAIFRKPPEIETPDAFKEMTENIDLLGSPLEVFAKGATSEVIAVGRYGVAVDVPLQGEARHAFLVGYPAESIISWREHIADGKSILTRVVLREAILTPKVDDPFELEETIQYRVLQLGTVDFGDVKFTTNVYSVTVFKQNLVDGHEVFTFEPPVVPLRAGAPLDFIPFQFFGPRELKPAIQKPPILGLVDENLGHWRTTVELRHGAHYTALPTLVVSGADDGLELTIGPASGMKLPEGAKAEILEFGGQGMTLLERMLVSAEKNMAVLGARLLEEPKSAAESGVALGMRHRGENSLLASISNTVSQGLTRVLNWAVWWSGGPETGSVIQLNKDFFEAPLSPEGMVQLITAWQSGGIGGDTLFFNLKQGERLPPTMTIEEWRQDLEENGPVIEFPVEPDEDEDDDEDEL